MAPTLRPDRVARWLRDEPRLPDSVAVQRLLDDDPLLDPPSARSAVETARRRVEGFGPIDALLADDAVTDVMVNGPGPVWVDRGHGCEPSGVHLDATDLERLVDRLLDPLGRRVDRASPLVDARLPDGSRVNIAVGPVATAGTIVTIRRFPSRAVPLEQFGPAPVVELVHRLVDQRANIVVSGGTGAGKTTLLNAIGGLLDLHERVVVLEDTAELRLGGAHVVGLEARPANAEGVGAVGLADLVVNALRMRPDRLVIGEVRGPEALDLLLALNTGHDGCLSTCHANDAAGVLRRLETLALGAGSGLPLAAVRRHLVGAVDAVVHLGRDAEGRRRIREVVEVADALDERGEPVLCRLDDGDAP